MAEVSVILGTLTLKSFEIPTEIAMGGSQGIAVHQLLGGKRVIDALGREERPLTWSGAFRGPDSQARADAVDQIRIAGQEVTLSWADRSYQVIVTSFEARWQRTYQILYSITCTVVQDNAITSSTVSATVDDLVTPDLDFVATTMPTLTTAQIPSGLGAITSDVAAIQGAVTAVATASGSLAAAPIGALSPVITAAQTCGADIGTALSAVDLLTQSNAGSVAGIVAGGVPSVMVAAFQAQSALISGQATLQAVSSLVGRIQINLQNATG